MATSKKDLALEKDDEESVTDRRHKIVDEVLGEQYQLAGVGTIFQVGQQSYPTFKDVCYVLNRLWVLGYAENYSLLPDGVPVEILGGSTPLTDEEKEDGKRAKPGTLGVTKDVANWLVPTLLQNIERQTLVGKIDILAPNNRGLVYLADVLGWYWHNQLRGPRPVTNKLLKMARPKIMQDAALSCPCCFHQFVPPKNLVTQQAKAYAFAAWLPKHFKEYHMWVRGGSTKKKSVSKK